MDYPGGFIVTTELLRGRQEVRGERRCYVAGFENGGRGCKPRNVRGSSKLEKVKKQIVP